MKTGLIYDNISLDASWNKKCFKHTFHIKSEHKLTFNNFLLKIVPLMTYKDGADKSLARPTSRCRRTESIVSFERGGGLFVCRIASLFLLQRLKGSMSGDARDFNNIETRVVNQVFFPARQGDEGNSRHSDRNIKGTCTIVCHRQKLSGKV